MATNGSLPNTIYPPPLYYHRLQRDEKERGYSTPEERLDFCFQNQRSTVHDAKATALHWEAIVGGPSPSTVPQPTDEGPRHDQELKEGPIGDGHKPLPLLMALAKEILSLEAKDSKHICRFEHGEEVEATPTKSKKAASRAKRNKQKPAHSKASAREFVRDCCIAGDTKTVPARGAATTPGGKAANLRSVDRAHNTNNVPYFHSPHSPSSYRGRTTGKIHNSRTDYYQTPTSGDGRGRRLVVHMPHIPATQDSRNIGRGAGSANTPRHQNSDLAYGASEDASVKQPSPVKTLMDELDNDITQAGSVTNKTSLELPAETGNVDVLPSHPQNIHVLAPEENTSTDGYVDISTRPSSVQDENMLQLDKESLGADTCEFFHRSETSSVPVSRVEFKGSSCVLRKAGASNDAIHKVETKNANIHKANDASKRVETSRGAVQSTVAKADANVDTFHEADASKTSNATGNDSENSVHADTSESVQTDWDDYSDDFISESP